MDVRNANERPLLIVPVAGLEEKEYPFRFSVEADELALAEFYEGKIEIEGAVAKVGSQFFVKGKVQGVRVGECDRCLVPTREEVEQDFGLYYRVSASAVEEEDEDNGDDRVRVLGPDEHSIVLDDEIRQSLRLLVPMKNLCDEECKGLCPQCGKNRNEGECDCDAGPIDPRWAKLAGLFDKEGKEGKN